MLTVEKALAVLASRKDEDVLSLEYLAQSLGEQLKQEAQAAEQLRDESFPKLIAEAAVFELHTFKAEAPEQRLFMRVELSSFGGGTVVQVPRYDEVKLRKGTYRALLFVLPVKE
jgi:hypothetical protein